MVEDKNNFYFKARFCNYGLEKLFILLYTYENGSKSKLNMKIWKFIAKFKLRVMQM